MRFILLLLVACIFQACYLGFEDGPPDIRYTKGDLWVNNFRNNGLSAIAFMDDKIYGTVAKPSDTAHFLYCLNLKTGMVDWTARVGNWATFPPVVVDSFIYYCSYVGNIYKFDRQGNKIWEQRAKGVYSEHCLNPLNNNLIVHTITDGAYDLAFSDGAVVNHFAKFSMASSLPVFFEKYMIQAGIKNDTTVVGEGRILRCMDYTTKKSIWEYDMEEIDKLYVNKGRVYFVSKDLIMHCIDIGSGNRLWQSESLNYPGSYGLGDNMVFDQGKIICWGSNMGLFLVVDEETGRSIVKNSYREVLDMHLMKPRTVKYAIKAGGEEYTVHVSDSLVSPTPEYNAEVTRH